MAMTIAALRRVSTSRVFKPCLTQIVHQSTSALANEEAYSRIEKEKSHVTWPKQLNTPLEEIDPEITNIIELEKNRQWKGLELIPSENFTSLSVMQAVGSIMTNKYSEGYPGARYYGGNE
eukprot:Gb_05874 [translate_table: standard]